MVEGATYGVSSSTDRSEYFLPYTRASQFSKGLLLDLSHIEERVFICADQDDCNTVLRPDICM